MGEDHFLGLATRAVGMRTGDFALDGAPLAVRWRGLPGEPADLLNQGKLVVHSVKSYGEFDGEAARARFRAARDSGGEAAP